MGIASISSIMSGNLKDFWFPLLLALCGVPTLFLSNSASGTARRVMLTVTMAFLFAAILAYIWGDPVRGPFAFIVHPKSPEHFSLQAGIQCNYPVKQLSAGIDFSSCIGMLGQPDAAGEIYTG